MPDQTATANDTANANPVNQTTDIVYGTPYDDEGNINPGWHINDETGQAYYDPDQAPVDETAAQDVVPTDDPNLEAAPTDDVVDVETAQAVDPNVDTDLSTAVESEQVDVQAPEDVNPGDEEPLLLNALNKS